MLQSDSQKILERTNDGLTVFTHYLGEGCLAKKFCNPFRKDRHPSCRLYENRNSSGMVSYYMYDFAVSECSGDCFWMVGKQLGLDLSKNFKEILETIDRDLCLGVFESTPMARTEGKDYAMRMVKKYHQMEESSIVGFKVAQKSFSENELSFWEKYGIGFDTLSKFDVVSVRSCTFTRHNGGSFTKFSSKAIPMFGYRFAGGDGYKFYCPGSTCRFLYAGNLPKPYVFGWGQLPASGDRVFITGGEKDVMTLSAHGFAAISFNSETASIPEEKMEELGKRFGEIVILYDSDETGRNESARQLKQFQDKYAVRRMVLPLSGTKKEKDVSDYFSLGHTSGEFEKLLDKQDG